MSDNHTPTLWWVDEENVTVVSVECSSPDVDAAGRRIYRHATHFDSERGAWDALGVYVIASVLACGRIIANAEADLHAAPPQHQAATEAVLRNYEHRAAIATRNFALYHERRQEWQRQVEQELRTLAPAPTVTPPPPQTFQRGDVVDVTLGDIPYRALVTATRRGKLYIRTRYSGNWFDPRRTAIALIERRGRRNAATLHEWAQEFA